MDIHNTVVTRENVVEFLSTPGANSEHAVSVVRGLLEEVKGKEVRKPKVELKPRYNGSGKK